MNALSLTHDLNHGRRFRSNFPCPHCDAPGQVRASIQVTPLYRDVYYQCSEVRCGFTWKAELAFVHGISPSAAPRDGLDLPMSQLPIPRAVATGPPIDDPNQMNFSL